MIKKIIIVVSIIIIILIIFGITMYVSNDKKRHEEEVKIPILLYHNIVTKLPETDEYNYEYITTIESFEENIVTLIKNGYEIISLNDLYYMDKANQKLPSKPIIINFDDGLISNYELAFKIIEKHKIKVGMGITTDLVGTKDEAENREYFSWEQAKEMQDSGLVDFHSHGKRHIFYRDIRNNRI